MKTKEIHNAFLLSIIDNEDVVIRVISLQASDVFLMKQLITESFENETGGITIRLKLKTNYAL